MVLIELKRNGFILCISENKLLVLHKSLYHGGLNFQLHSVVVELAFTARFETVDFLKDQDKH